MLRIPARTSCFILLPLLSLTAPARELPWWGQFPRIVQGRSEDLKPYHADIVFGGGLNAPSWGLWGQVMFGQPQSAEAVHAEGGRMITYFETFGQSYCVIVSIPDAQLNTEHPRASASHWSWQNYKGDPIYWAGAHTWFDDRPEARPWTRTHPEFGGPPMCYPDGTIATGYSGDPASPLNHRAFDAGCSKNILGAISFEIDPVSPEVQQNGPHDGLALVNGTYAGILYMHKDSACPHWLDLDAAAVRYAAAHGADGMWSDNYSPWDSFGIRPVDRGFGEWSVALFRDYLKEKFGAEVLARMGVADLATFDVRAALRNQLQTWGGDPANLQDPVWRDVRWLDHDLWHAYVIFKRQQGTRALRAYDERMHAAAAAADKPDFLIAGNDIPALSLGWVRGDLDLVSTESPAGYGLDAGSRGLLLPPAGRHSVRYRLAGVHARSNTVSIWPYLDDEFARYARNPNLTRVMAYEMLAANALPMAYPSLPRVLGDPEAYADFFRFVGEARGHFGQRRPCARTGLYYSSSSLLAFMTPGGFLDFNARPHQFGYYGWATALHDMHEPYIPVPEWQLTAETLAGLDLLIVPNAVAMEQAEVETLRAWIATGGRLIVTGDSAVREGESGNFAKHDRGPLHAQLAGGGVSQLDDNVGMAYYIEENARAGRLPGMAEQVQAARGTETAAMINAPGVPATVGITPHYDPERKALFIDVNNLNIDVDGDAVMTTAAITFEVTLPPALRGIPLKHQVLSPDNAATATISPTAEGRVTVALAPISYYASVEITPER
jgi:hypothetical protein